MPLDQVTFGKIAHLLDCSETKLRHLRRVCVMSAKSDARFFDAIQELTEAKLLLNSEIQKLNSTQASQ